VLARALPIFSAIGLALQPISASACPMMTVAVCGSAAPIAIRLPVKAPMPRQRDQPCGMACHAGVTTRKRQVG
jgi:hypothetical protein